MDSYIPPSDNEMWYGAIATGKRIPEIYGLSSNLDPDGDNIIDTTQDNLLYRREGPDGHLNFAKGVRNSIDITKIIIILMLFGAAQLGIYSGTFGCKGEYIQIRWGWTSQFVLFCIVLINMIIEVEGSRNNDTTWGIIAAAFATWILLNIVAKIGDSWLVFSSPFWPTPLTYWGVTMLLGVVIYALDQHRIYWLQSKDQSSVDRATRKSDYFANLEYFLVIAFLTIITWRFGIETINEYRRLGKKFNFIKFFLGTKTHDKMEQHAGLSRSEGLCKKKTNERLKREIEKGIKNSWWRKFRDNLG